MIEEISSHFLKLLYEANVVRCFALYKHPFWKLFQSMAGAAG